MDIDSNEKCDDVVNTESEEIPIDAEIVFDPSPRTQRLLRRTKMSSKAPSNTTTTPDLHGEDTRSLSPMDYKLNNTDDTITMTSSQWQMSLDMGETLPSVTKPSPSYTPSPDDDISRMT